MTWAKVDDRLWDDPRVEQAGLDAFGLWAKALSFVAARRTGGAITKQQIFALAGHKAHWLAQRLVDAGLWSSVEPRSFRFVDAERFLVHAKSLEPHPLPPPVTPGVRASRKANPPPTPPGVPAPPFPSPPIDPRAHAPISDLRSGSLTGTSEPGSSGSQKQKIQKRAATASRAVVKTSEQPALPGLEVPPQKPPAAERYAAAYERGHADSGFPITPLTASEKALLGPIAKTHALYRDGTAITGADLVQWFYRRGRSFRADVPDPSRHGGGASPFGFRRWLDNGADGEERPLAPGQEEAPEDDTDAQLIELMKAEDAAKEASRAPLPPASPAAREAARRMVYRFAGKPLPEDAPKVAADG